MKRMRRAIESSANANATTGPFTDTRLLSEGHSDYLLAQPTGPLLISFDQYDKTTASDSSTFSGQYIDAAWEPRFSGLGSMNQHVGVTPTIVQFSSGRLEQGIRPGQKSGTVRIWTCATPDKRNGVWAEVETVTGLGPVRLSNGAQFVEVNSTNVTTSLETDPGYQQELPYYPGTLSQDVPARRVFRTTRLRFGYAVDGEEVVQGDFYDPEGLYPWRWAIELALDPAGLDEGNGFEGHSNIASVLLHVSDLDLTLLPGTQGFFGIQQYKFAIDVAAASTPESLLQDRKNLIEWLPPLATGPHDPWGMLTARQKTAVNAGYSLCLPMIPTGPSGPTGVKFVRPYAIDAPGFFGGRSSVERYFTWQGEAAEHLPGPTYDAHHAVKSGPAWHGQSLVPAGTARAVDYDRHDLEFVFPAYAPTISGAFIEYTVSNVFGQSTTASARGQLNVDALHLGVAVSGQTIQLQSFVEEQQLMSDRFRFFKQLPTASFSNTAQGPAPVQYEYDVDYVLNGSARADIGNYFFSNPAWTATFPWPSLAAAKAAGVDEDQYWFLRSAPGDLQSVVWRNSQIAVRFQATFKITVKRIGDIACNYLMFRRLEGSFFIDLTPEQCRNLGNGQTVQPNVLTFVTAQAGVGVGTLATATGQLRLVPPPPPPATGPTG
jgi:hypothetical protein